MEGCPTGKRMAPRHGFKDLVSQAQHPATRPRLIRQEQKQRGMGRGEPFRQGLMPASRPLPALDLSCKLARRARTGRDRWTRVVG